MFVFFVCAAQMVGKCYEVCQNLHLFDEYVLYILILLYCGDCLCPLL